MRQTQIITCEYWIRLRIREKVTVGLDTVPCKNLRPHATSSVKGQIAHWGSVSHLYSSATADHTYKWMHASCTRVVSQTARLQSRKETQLTDSRDTVPEADRS